MPARLRGFRGKSTLQAPATVPAGGAPGCKESLRLKELALSATYGSESDASLMPSNSAVVR
jgi:hypothetical protein